MRIAINGFGRIGKNFLRMMLERQEREPSIDCISINIGDADPQVCLYALRYDSLMGPYRETVVLEDDMLIVGNYRIRLLAEMDAARLPWKALNIDWVVDVTGAYCTREKAMLHCAAGARAVLISAPARGDDATIIMGFNEQTFDSRLHRIVSLGSCTTNAAVPLLGALMHSGTLTAVSLATTHAYTNSQSLVDRVGHATDDMRHLRAAPINIIPAHTGAADSIIRVMPHLAGSIISSAYRVPVPAVSVLELVIMMQKKNEEQKVLDALVRSAAEKPHIIGISDEQLVSTDFKGDTRSVIVDMPLCAHRDAMVKLVGWYDNEYGYAARMIDFLRFVERAV